MEAMYICFGFPSVYTGQCLSSSEISAQSKSVLFILKAQSSFALKQVGWHACVAFSANVGLLVHQPEARGNVSHYPG